MHLMKLRAGAVVAPYPVDPWTTTLTMHQHGFAYHVAGTRWLNGIITSLSGQLAVQVVLTK